MSRRVCHIAAMAAALFMAVPGFAHAQTGWGIGVLRTGDVYFCDDARDRVWKLAPNGHLTVALDDTHCHALVAGPDDVIYGESVSSAIISSAELGVWRLSADGVRRWLEPPSLSPDPGIWIVFDRQRRGFSWNGAETGANISQIIRRDQDGSMIALAGGAWGNRDGLGADARFGHVAGMAVAPDGSLVVIDTGSIRRIDPIGAVRTEAKGVVTGETGGSPLRVGLWNYTMGAATDVDGAAVVVDYAAKRIVRVARDGRATELWHSGGLANALTRRAWGWRPTGVAMLGSSFYVLEELPLPPLLADLIGSPRLLHVERDGTTTRVVTVSGMLVRVAAALLLLTLLSWWRTARRGRRPAPGLAPPPRPSDAPPSHG